MSSRPEKLHLTRHLPVAVLTCLTFAVLSLCSTLQTAPTRNSELPLTDQLIHTRTVDTTHWDTYTNDSYAYEFKYPPTWYVGSPATDFHFEKSVAIYNPREILFHEDSDSQNSAYRILVNEVAMNIFPLSSTSSTETLAKQLTGLPSGNFRADRITTKYQDAILIYAIRGEENDFEVIILPKNGNSAFSISSDNQAIAGPSAEDIVTFVGIYSTFKII